MKLKNWTAKRSGGRITIYGVDVETKKETKIAGIDQIMVTSDGIVAIDKDGGEHELDAKLRAR